MKLSYEGIQDMAAWKAAGVALPRFDWKKMCRETKENPVWVHFGAGNIFRGFIARLQQNLIEQGAQDRGVIAVDTFDFDIIDRIYGPYDNMALMVSLMADGSMKKEVVASIGRACAPGAPIPRILKS